MSLKLMAMWISMYLIAGIIALLFEFGPLKGMAVTAPKVIYVLQVIKKMVDRLDEKEYPEEKIEKIYMACSVLRLAAFSIVIEYGVVLYYLLSDTIGLYISAIAAICSLFAVPTKAGIEHETGYYDD